MGFALLLLAIVFLTSLPMGFADSEDRKVEFATNVEETLGHFWALEKNLDENNAELALVHATHPIAELYDSMSEKLADNPKFDATLQQTLMDLQHKATTDVDRETAQLAINEAKEIIEEARIIVVGEELSNKDHFKAKVAVNLLEISKEEYQEAVSNGEIKEIAEFQDGSAFVLRSKIILSSMNVSFDQAEEFKKNFNSIEAAYKRNSEPLMVSALVDLVIEKAKTLSGESFVESLIFASPKEQVRYGVEPENVECNQGKILLLNNDNNRPACVFESSVDKLVERGWKRS